jgi:dienelactone hydrolase
MKTNILNPRNESLRVVRILSTCIMLLAATTLHGQLIPVDKVRNDFSTLLQRPVVAPKPSIQVFLTDSIQIEKGYFYSEATEKVPLLIYKPETGGTKKFPVVICLHGTGGNKEGMKDLLDRFSKSGFIAVAIDGRYHGERVKAGPGQNKYVEAIISAWQNKDSTHQEHPFFFDTVYDLWKLVDYLLTRTDVDSTRIGMMGISKGGIETWMAASVDTRIKVAVPVIAAQSFKWSLENDRWQGRARTIWAAHVQAAKDMGDTGVNKQNVQALWNKLLPGITSEFDCPSMIRLFAPRPLLILNTGKDQNCPLTGAQLAFDEAREAYRAKNALNKLKIDVEPNDPHRYTPRHMELTVEWFRKWL